jgi:hypothetical protein
MSHAGQDLTPQQQVERVAANRASAVGQMDYGHNRTGAIAAAQAIPGQDRDMIQKTTPYLEEYLSWKKTNPSKDVADFLSQRFGK